MKTQMELGLDNSNQTNTTCRRVRRRTAPGARWWFSQMHAAVDRAFEWSRTAQVRPEQTYITFGGRAAHRRGHVPSAN
jgi:hypothetical protein